MQWGMENWGHSASLRKLWVINQKKTHQNQYIQRLLAVDGKCKQLFQPNMHPQIHTLGFGGGVLLFFSLWPLVGESVPVARLAWGTVLCLAPGDTCMAASWAAYNCFSETERERERTDRGRRDRRVDEGREKGPWINEYTERTNKPKKQAKKLVWPLVERADGCLCVRGQSCHFMFHHPASRGYANS